KDSDGGKQGLCFLWPLSTVGSFFRVRGGGAGALVLGGENRRDSALMQVSFGSGVGTDCQLFRAGMASFGTARRFGSSQNTLTSGSQGLFVGWSPQWVRFFEWPGSGAERCVFMLGVRV